MKTRNFSWLLILAVVAFVATVVISRVVISTIDGISLINPDPQLTAVNPNGGQQETVTQGLKLEKLGTEQVYFAYNGKPLLSFGGLSDFIFYAAPDAYNYQLWADWAAEHGINHVRAYPPMSWKYIEQFATENGGSLNNVLFPYEETSPGSRQFDLTKFNDAYWQRFRQQCEYLESKGIIIHLLMVNGWQLGKYDIERDWDGHFFNPANNINSFSDYLADDRLKFYHSVVDDQTGLVEAQQAWLRKLVEMTADLDNVYYDLVHEIAESHSDWSKVQPWLEVMATTIRDRYTQLQPNKQVILGMDVGGLNRRQRHWIFTRPYFDLLIYGKSHEVKDAIDWRKRYKKPYIPQESWDDNSVKYTYRNPSHRIHTRKYMWKFMMAKCQQLDLYMKNHPKGRLQIELNRKYHPESPPNHLPGYEHNYDPNGWNDFEKDALVLRQFWNSLADYPNLWFNGKIQGSSGNHQYVLSSSKEAVAYMSSDTGKQNVNFDSQTLRLNGLVLKDGNYKADIIQPDRGIIDHSTVTVQDGVVSVSLPSFTDDIAVHIHSRAQR